MKISAVAKDVPTTAYLLSNTITPNSDQCVEFYFYNDYKSYGKLSMYLRQMMSNRNETSGTEFNSFMLDFPVWTNKYIHLNFKMWRRAQVPINHALSSKPFQLVFEKYIPVGNESNRFTDLIDDVFIRDESCLPPGDCDFENGLCI